MPISGPLFRSVTNIPAAGHGECGYPAIQSSLISLMQRSETSLATARGTTSSQETPLKSSHTEPASCVQRAASVLLPLGSDEPNTPGPPSDFAPSPLKFDT